MTRPSGKADEPYRSIVFDGLVAPDVSSLVRRSIVVNSWSKALSLAGKRIGFAAVSPRLDVLFVKVL